MSARDDLMAELSAAEISWQLATIAKAQHRISCALNADNRQDVLRHLKELGISEASASAFVCNPLSQEEMASINSLLKAIEGWRPHLAQQVRVMCIKPGD